MFVHDQQNSETQKWEVNTRAYKLYFLLSLINVGIIKCESKQMVETHHLPKEMNTNSMGGVSKKVMGLVSSDMAIEAVTTETE